MNREFIEAIDELERERHIPKSVIIEGIEAALVAAYKRNYGNNQNVRVGIDEENGEVSVLARMEVVDEVYDEMTEISIDEALEIDKRYEIGDFIEFEVKPKDFGRIAAQAAKQVVVQKIREAERNLVYDDYKNMKDNIVTGIVNRISGETVFINIGETEGILSPHEQVPLEEYSINERLKVFIMDVRRQHRGPQVFLSRTHPGLVEGLFELEVPEIQDGTVEIKNISREAGFRSKVCVYTDFENVDPVGACVGPRGIRVQNIVDELGGEKIDIIPWDEDPEILIANVLSPAKVSRVIVEQDDEDEKMATAIVPDYQLSLAIGKEGQNVRLAAKVSGWKIDIKSESQYEKELEEVEAEFYDEFDEDKEFDDTEQIEQVEELDQIEEFEKVEEAEQIEETEI